MTRGETILTILGSLVCLAVGILSLSRPHAIQNYVLKLYEGRRAARKLSPFLPWMETPSYIWSLRLVGGLAVLISLGVLTALFFALKRGAN
jgi:hypothetical protein